MIKLMRLKNASAPWWKISNVVVVQLLYLKFLPMLESARSQVRRGVCKTDITSFVIFANPSPTSIWLRCLIAVLD